MSQNDSAVHLSLRQSYSSRQVQRMALSFETFEEAKERAKTTPPKVREWSHTASPDNIEGKLDQLLQHQCTTSKPREVTEHLAMEAISNR